MSLPTATENLLYCCIRELGYVQSCCSCGLGKSALAEELIQKGMEVLGVTNLREDFLLDQREFERKA